MRLNKVFISSDHAGFNLKKSIIQKFSKKQKIVDLGPSSDKSVDYPDYAQKLSKKNALNCVGIFLKTKFEGGRHLIRIKKI